MNDNYNALKFYLFWAQNQDKSFDEFGTLFGDNKLYTRIKIKDLILGREDHDENYYNRKRFNIISKNNPTLCWYWLDTGTFDGFVESEEKNLNSLNIMEHISFDDKV